VKSTSLLAPPDQCDRAFMSSLSESPSFFGYVHSEEIANLIFAAARNKKCVIISQRLNRDRHRISAGQGYVYDNSFKGLSRWTDGVRWSDSIRQGGKILVYKELQNVFHVEGENGPGLKLIKPGGLCKRTISEVNGSMRLVCYYDEFTDRLAPIRLVPNLQQTQKYIAIPRTPSTQVALHTILLELPPHLEKSQQERDKQHLRSQLRQEDNQLVRPFESKSANEPLHYGPAKHHQTRHQTFVYRKPLFLESPTAPKHTHTPPLPVVTDESLQKHTRDMSADPRPSVHDLSSPLHSSGMFSREHSQGWSGPPMTVGSAREIFSDYENRPTAQSISVREGPRFKRHQHQSHFYQPEYARNPSSHLMSNRYPHSITHSPASALAHQSHVHVPSHTTGNELQHSRHCFREPERSTPTVADSLCSHTDTYYDSTEQDMVMYHSDGALSHHTAEQPQEELAASPSRCTWPLGRNDKGQLSNVFERYRSMTCSQTVDVTAQIDRYSMTGVQMERSPPEFQSSECLLYPEEPPVKPKPQIFGKSKKSSSLSFSIKTLLRQRP